MPTVLAYHFCGPKLRDGRPIPPDSEWLAHDGPVVMCVSGLHASRHPFDALQYAPGSILCRVECDDIVKEHDGKLVCRRRRIITRIDATELCRQAARRYALDVLHLWDAPDVVRRYLETGDESSRDAAWAAARVAARNAAWDAARNAARNAAWDAARDAAWDAAWAAAWDAARDAAWDAAWDAARDAARAAARNAARNAAWNAATQRQRDIFAELVTAAMEAA